MRPDINSGGTGLGWPPKLTSFETPIVQLICLHGPLAGLKATNI